MHQHAGRRGVDPALRLGDRHPLHAVHAALVLQPGVRASPGSGVPLALTATVDVLVAAEVGLGGVEDLGLPAAPLGVAQVHPQQVAGEQRRLLAALARLDLEDDVLVVVGSRGTSSSPQPLLELAATLRLELGRPRRRTPGPRRPARGPPRRRRRPPATRGRSRRPGSARRTAGPAARARPGRRARRGRPAAARASACSATRVVDGLEHRSGPPSTRQRPSGPGHDNGAGRPPQGRSDRRRGALLASAVVLAVARLEAGHAATGVEDLLLAGVERVALASRPRRGCSPLVAVLRVVNVVPQVQVTWVSTYSGWMSFFMAVPLESGRRVAAVRRTLDVNRSQRTLCHRSTPVQANPQVGYSPAQCVGPVRVGWFSRRAGPRSWRPLSAGSA